jgi:hypothetical protein
MARSWLPHGDAGPHAQGSGLGHGPPGSELARLVVEADRDAAELLSVLTGVVGAEQELTAAGEGHADVGLGSATVASVISGQLRVRGKC